MGKTIKLTPNQWKAYDFIRNYRDEKGFVPSVRELQEYMGYKSSSSAHHILMQLHYKGAIDRQANCPRAYSINTEGIYQ